MHLALLDKTLDDLKAEYMGTSESADAISNKQLDGVWVMRARRTRPSPRL